MRGSTALLPVDFGRDSLLQDACDYFGTIFAKLNGTDPWRKGDKKRGQYKFNKLVRKALTRFKAARSLHLQKMCKAELDLVLRAKDLVALARHYERVVLVCKFVACRSEQWTNILIGFFLRSSAPTKFHRRLTPWITCLS